MKNQRRCKTWDGGVLLLMVGLIVDCGVNETADRTDRRASPIFGWFDGFTLSLTGGTYDFEPGNLGAYTLDETDATTSTLQFQEFLQPRLAVYASEVSQFSLSESGGSGSRYDYNPSDGGVTLTERDGSGYSLSESGNETRTSFRDVEINQTLGSYSLNQTGSGAVGSGTGASGVTVNEVSSEYSFQITGTGPGSYYSYQEHDSNYTIETGNEVSGTYQIAGSGTNRLDFQESGASSTNFQQSDGGFEFNAIRGSYTITESDTERTTTVETESNQTISVHGSGIATYQQTDGGASLSVRGNYYLMDTADRATLQESGNDLHEY